MQQLDRLECDGVIKKVFHSAWAAPIVAVPKKDGCFRICGNYKVTINPSLEVDQYPLSNPTDLYASLTGRQKFTKLDLSQAYQQLLLDEALLELTTITTHQGLYQYTRLPFGVASAPAIFQRTMDTILQGMTNVICYIDDILITGINDNQHLENLTEVLHRLEKHGLWLKKSKCMFLQTEVEYLGHRVDAEGLHPTEEKRKAILQAPHPQNQQQLRSFLGLLNYYAKFIPNLSTILHPLHRLLYEKVKWYWDIACTKAFKLAKEALSSSRVLVHYNPKFPITLAGDVSAYGLGAVISHILPDGSEHPVAFASCTLSPAECKYAQLEKEAASLIFGIKKFHQFLYGRKFILITNNKPLMAILGLKKGIPSLAAACLQCWAVCLSAYTYDIQFKPTKAHANADGLSRLPLPTSPRELNVISDASVFNMGQIDALPVTSTQVQHETKVDPILSKVLQYTKYGWPSQIQKELEPYKNHCNEFTIEGHCLLWGIRVVIPAKLQAKVLHELHSSHAGMSRMKSLARSYLWWPKVDKDIEELVKSCRPCLNIHHAPAVAPSPMGLAFEAMAENSRGFCWAFPRDDVSSSSGCTLQVA